MPKAHIELATLIRIERTAGLVRSMVEQTFAHLQFHLLSSADPKVLKELSAPMDDQLDGATTAVSRLATQVLGSLFTMCDLITQNSNPTPEVRARFAHILSRRPAEQNPIVDLRLQRLLRLPIDQALEIVLRDLEAGCAEINKRVSSISIPARLDA